MHLVKEELARRQARFGRHPFFSRSDSTNDLAFVAQRLTFWVLVFQDVLRLNETWIRDSELHAMAIRHRQEDAGHDQWFMQDLQTLGVGRPDFNAVFGPNHAQTRDVSYEVVSEVFRATNDQVRIALILTLESIGHVFFARAADIADRTGLRRNLHYFGRSHLDVEHDHDLLEHESAHTIDQIVLSEDVRAETMEMIERVYQVFFSLFDSFVEALPPSAPPAVAAGGP